jgi:hypothetical protein
MEHKCHEEGRQELKVQNGSKGKNGTGGKNADLSGRAV